ncbi:RNA polymerase sigma-70 factor [Fulvivirga ulvae]|uniref:RNA polymerase sigma-70 factor n=1 Tax=Fulvivirga ulvae TaxID=2904245 RepID=UPI001F46B08F|nr:RNA polymerase sigma-70 factor [Fulvivirga ulvae]UII35021.1 RNA polymerase sigma-70 factor [Fulvivirga ulvae]
MREFSEEYLLRKMRSGNEKAFESIFRYYYRPLTLFAVKYVEDIEQAREITQEFFVRLWTNNPSIKNGSLKTYLYRGVRNACLNHIEATKVAEKRLRHYTEPDFTIDNALRNMLLAEQEEELMATIDKLPSRCRQIFILSRMEELSHKEIADRMNISVKTVEAQMTIALRRLKEALLFFIYTCLSDIFF